jgi:hypothetical protein
MGRAADLVWSNARKSLYEFGNAPAGINKGVKPVQDFVTLKLDRAHLNDFFPVCVQPGRFQVQGNEGLFQRGDGCGVMFQGHFGRPFVSKMERTSGTDNALKQSRLQEQTFYRLLFNRLMVE